MQIHIRRFKSNNGLTSGSSSAEDAREIMDDELWGVKLPTNHIIID